MIVEPIISPIEPDRRQRSRYLGETIKPETGDSYDWHTHEFGQLISAAKGTMFVGTPDCVLLLSPAMIVWIPPDMAHWMRYGANDVMQYVDVNPEEACHLGAASRVLAMTPLLSALFSATMPESMRLRDDRHNTALHDLFRYELLNARDVPLSLALPRDSRVSALAEVALNDPGRVQSVETWLSDAPASRKTIERIFISETGMPPSRWLRYARVLHAISLLAAGQKVSAVALDMGYESSSAFGHMFRQVIGESPGKFLSKQPPPAIMTGSFPADG